MIQSMTGYASATIDIPIAQDQKLSLSVQIKSLNSRYFEATCKVPYLLTDLDVALQKLLKHKLQRGHVYVTIKIQHDQVKHAVVPALSTIQGYIAAINIIKQECHIKDEISLQTILNLPNIFQIEDAALSKTTEAILLQEFDKLIDQLIVMRLEEGAVLEKDIHHQINIVEQKLTLIKAASAQIAQEKKAELEKVMTTLQTFSVEDQSTDKCLLENQKSALLLELDKIDIHEEIVRAHAHVASILQWLKVNELSKGKKMDFILQELNREINTIASKCCHFAISSLAIDIKSELEKCREQTQNIV